MQPNYCTRGKSYLFLWKVIWQEKTSIYPFYGKKSYPPHLLCEVSVAGSHFLHKCQCIQYLFIEISVTQKPQQKPKHDPKLMFQEETDSRRYEFNTLHQCPGLLFSLLIFPCLGTNICSVLNRWCWNKDKHWKGVASLSSPCRLCNHPLALGTETGDRTKV